MYILSIYIIGLEAWSKSSAPKNQFQLGQSLKICTQTELGKTNTKTVPKWVRAPLSSLEVAVLWVRHSKIQIFSEDINMLMYWK